MHEDGEFCGSHCDYCKWIRQMEHDVVDCWRSIILITDEKGWFSFEFYCSRDDCETMAWWKKTLIQILKLVYLYHSLAIWLVFGNDIRFQLLVIIIKILHNVPLPITIMRNSQRVADCRPHVLPPSGEWNWNDWNNSRAAFRTLPLFYKL